MSDEDIRIEYLVDFVKNKIPYNSHEETVLYDELLQLADKCNNSYAQALAYIKFARLHQELQQVTQYFECAKKAYEISLRENFSDLLIRYYNLEGIRYMQNYDEANALSMYLKGIDAASQAFEYTLCAVLYNNIAEIFYDNIGYEKAIEYYLKALKTLDAVGDDEARQYRKIFILNLISAYCLMGDLENAKKHMHECKQINCEYSMRPFAQNEAEIRILLLENKQDQALQSSLMLLDELNACKIDENLLYYTFAFLCDVFLQFKIQNKALYCINKLEHMKMEISQKYTMETQKRKINYYEIFSIENNDVYKKFYEMTLEFDLNNTNAISSSLSTAVTLYETEKEQRIIKKERNNLEKYIMFDPLTGVYNRRVFNKIVEECLSTGAVDKIAYIMIDIDNFKEYNDYYGHSQGDLVLQAVSSLIKELLPKKQAYFARYGGDEFVCLLVDKSMNEIEHFVTSIQHKLKKSSIEHLQSNTTKRITLSMGGYYSLSCNFPNTDFLFKKADEALYKVKNNGRNSYLIIRDE